MRFCTRPGVVVAAALIVLGGCKTTTSARGLGGRRLAAAPTAGATMTTTDPVVEPLPPVQLVRTPTQVELASSGPIVLGALITAPAHEKGPGIVIVPGGSDVSKEGTRKGDGVVVYPAPAHTGSLWSDAFAARGAIVLTYDKRTCGPNDTASCHKNPQVDVDAEGPGALAKDVDAACALVRKAPGFDGRLVLWAHGQAAQVALSSSCAQEATAIVLLSPIPRAIDAVLVGALTDRQQQSEARAKAASTPEERSFLLDQASALKNLAGTKAAGFASMKSGKFAKDARVDGATIAFWLGWMSLTERTRALLEPLRSKVVIVVGAGDQQLSSPDRKAAQALPATRVVVVEADHHLLVQGALDDEVVQQIADAIDVVIGVPVS